MTIFTARRNGPDFTLFANGFQIGTLVNCETCWDFEATTQGEELRDFVYIEGDATLREALAAVRQGYKRFEAEQAADAHAIHYAESAWLRAAECAAA